MDLFTLFPASAPRNNQVIYDIYSFSKHCDTLMFALAILSAYIYKLLFPKVCRNNQVENKNGTPIRTTTVAFYYFYL